MSHCGLMSGCNAYFICSFSPYTQMEFLIKHTWDSSPVNHDPIRIIFSPGQGGLKAEVFGPFFNDPAAPSGPPGQPFPGLWDYEGELESSSNVWWCSNLLAYMQIHMYNRL